LAKIVIKISDVVAKVISGLEPNLEYQINNIFLCPQKALLMWILLLVSLGATRKYSNTQDLPNPEFQKSSNCF
jgi:hypothetical protein